MNRAAGLQRIAFPLLALCCLGRSQAEELRDPTRPAFATSIATTPVVAAAPAARLEAVLHSEAGAVAIIDGKLLHVGDRLGEARIEAISSDAVHLTRAGRKVILRLANQAMKVRGDAPSKDSE